MLKGHFDYYNGPCYYQIPFSVIIWQFLYAQILNKNTVKVVMEKTFKHFYRRIAIINNVLNSNASIFLFVWFFESEKASKYLGLNYS